MILQDAHTMLNLIIVCSLLGFLIELIYRFIASKSLLAAFIPAFLFSPLYGFSLSLYLSIKPDSKFHEFTMIISIIFLVEATKRMIVFFLNPKISKGKWLNVCQSVIVWVIFFACFSEWAYPRVVTVIRSLPYSYLIIFVLSLLYIVAAFLLQRISRELQQTINELQSIFSARQQLDTADNEITHGLMEVSVAFPQAQYLETLHEEYVIDVTDLNRQYDAALLKLSPIQQKLIKAYPVLLPLQRKDDSQ